MHGRSRENELCATLPTAPDLRDPLKPETEIVAVGNEKPREACGIFGAYIPGHEAARAAFFGIFALQHRGQESAGIAASNGLALSLTAEVGLVSQVFQENDLTGLQGHLAIAPYPLFDHRIESSPQRSTIIGVWPSRRDRARA